ncbi:IS3 family transposase [Microbacterium testaceum]|uniref:IS3 family transposase n=1 Tax=Microbacterium testaceum TaxID=2033 RepID=UPI000A9F12BA|nr:IS3 family transposase [Microbacterium testaceum]
MDSFFSLLHKNVLNTRRWDSREALRLAMVIWIETTYNRRRRQRGPGRLTPIEFEMTYTDAKQPDQPKPRLSTRLGRVAKVRGAIEMAG